MRPVFYLGIDQHANQLTVSLRDSEGNVVLRRQVSTRPEKVLAFFEKLTARCAARGGTFWATVEVCGFNDWLIEMLKNFRCGRIVLVQPETRGKGRFKKTDRRDAAKLSEQLWQFRNRIEQGKPIEQLKIVKFPSAQVRAKRRFTELRKQTRAARTRSINQIKHILRRHNIQHDLPTKTFPCIKAISWCKSLKLPRVDRFEMDQALADLQHHDLRVKQLDTEINRLSKDDADAHLLMQTPGIAQFSAVALSSRIDGIDRFKRPRSLANYFGLTPGCRNSGEKERIGKITKAGSCMARWVLGQASKHILRVDDAMRAWFKRLKRKRGAKVARVAVMRRIATIIWHMLTKRKTYAEIRQLGIGLEAP